MKPRIFKTRMKYPHYSECSVSIWVCQGNSCMGTGLSPTAAYDRWLANVNLKGYKHPLISRL